MNRRTAVFAAIWGTDGAAIGALVAWLVPGFPLPVWMAALAGFTVGAVLIVAVHLAAWRPIDLGDVASHRDWSPGPDGVVTTKLPEAGDRP